MQKDGRTKLIVIFENLRTRIKTGSRFSQNTSFTCRAQRQDQWDAVQHSVSFSVSHVTVCSKTFCHAKLYYKFPPVSYNACPGHLIHRFLSYCVLPFYSPGMWLLRYQNRFYSAKTFYVCPMHFRCLATV